MTTKGHPISDNDNQEDEWTEEDLDNIVINFAPGVVYDNDGNYAIDDSHPEIREAREQMGDA